MAFSILPPALVVGQDISVDEFFSALSTPSEFDMLGTFPIAFDTETTGLDNFRDMPVFASASDGKDRWLLTPDHLLDERFMSMLEDPERTWIFANAKYDMHMLSNLGLPEIRGPVMDVTVMCLLRDENRKGGAGLGLKEQAFDYLGIKMRSFKDTFDLKVKASDEGYALINAPIDKVAGYATLDAYATFLLAVEHAVHLDQYDISRHNIRGYKTLWDYYVDLEMPFTKTLWRMERRGFKLDLNGLKELELPTQEKMDSLLKEITRLAKRPLNPNSPKQLGEIFFGPKDAGGLGLRPKKLTATGNPSTDESVLQGMRSKVPLADKILQYRALAKIQSTYIKALQRQANWDGRIRCSFKQTGTVTGRLSSSNPNLQNIPAKTEMGKRIREQFIADEGKVLLVSDYSQMEMCIMAHLSQDENMIRAISDGLDLHSFTASSMLGVEYDDVVYVKKLSDIEDWDVRYKTAYDKYGLDAADVDVLFMRAPELLGARRAAKAIGFGLMYGRGPGALADELGVSRKEAKQKIADWFSTFPSVKQYISDVQCQAIDGDDHAVFTIMGRPRRLHNIVSTNHGVSAKAERDAINAPIQGSASCIAKLAMILIDQDPELGGDCLEGGSANAQMLLQVHDEIIIEVGEEQDLQCLNDKMQRIMVNAAQLSVPLTTSGGIAINWGEAK